jgi:toluene monooxygenase system protein E
MGKTYWHLLAARRMPTEYELVSSELLYQPRQGLAVRTPAANFQARFAPLLHCSNWEGFRDPRETTYTSYVTEQREREIFVERLLASIDDTDYDRALDPSWLRVLERAFAPLRYPCHGLHMVAAYLGQAAPSGRITIAGAFQAGDELRRVQRLAYRTQQLMLAHPGFGADAQGVWERDAALQPLREVIERLLVCYEWSEAFVALQLVVKPLFDEFSCGQLAALALRRGDDVLGRMLGSLRDDQLWHRRWSAALVEHLLNDDPSQRAAIQDLIDKWQPRMLAALDGLLSLIPGDGADAEAVQAEQRQLITACGLGRAPSPASGAEATLEVGP